MQGPNFVTTKKVRGPNETWDHLSYSQKIVQKLTCSGVILAEGVYSSNLLTKSMASGEVRARKTFCQGCALIWGNLNSV